MLVLHSDQYKNIRIVSNSIYKFCTNAKGTDVKGSFGNYSIKGYLIRHRWQNCCLRSSNATLGEYIQIQG